MSKPRVDIGRYGIWFGGIDALPTPAAMQAAQHIESLGFGALWVAEAVGRDPFVSSAVLLGATTKLRVATGIANIYARDPMTMVAGQKTVAEAFPVSAGLRLLPGLLVGTVGEAQPGFGIPRQHRRQRRLADLAADDRPCVQATKHIR